MTKYVLVSGLLMTSAALFGQSDKPAGVNFQYFVTGPDEPGPMTGTVGGTIRMIGIDALSAGTVIGKPLSATEERHTLQVLGDGTRIENNQTDLFYRDDQGRTRVEHPDGRVLIQNPVEGFVAELKPHSKTAHRNSVGVQSKLDAEKRTLGSRVFVQTMVRGEMESAMPGAPGPKLTQSNEESFGVQSVNVESAGSARKSASNEESLGVQSVNGVTAEGRRSSTTIEAHQIGNDRPIQVISERWFSPDLKMLVRSTNSDPRFGETSYQLTNVNQAAPDPSLFQIPADYTITGGK